MQLTTSIIATILQLAIPDLALARWLSPDEADLVAERYDCVIDIDANYLATETTEKTYRILNESGRETLSTLTYRYNESIEQMTIDAVSVESAGVVRTVDRKYIEDKAISKKDGDFSDRRRIHIALPALKVGDRVHVRTTSRELQPIIPGIYMRKFAFAQPQIIKAGATLRINAKIPLHMRISDPPGLLAVRHTKSPQREMIDIRLTRDAYYELSEDDDGSFSSERPYPVIHVASVGTWTEYARIASAAMEPRLSTPLTPWMQGLLVSKNPTTAGAAATHPSTMARHAETIMLNMSERLRYISDGRTSDSFRFPRSFAEIEATEFGDCKDFSALLVALLRHYGYKANVAWVYRGGLPDAAGDFPDDAMFNHAIVHTTDEHGASLWLDPTNQNVYVGGPRADIAGRATVVLDATNPRLTMIPSVDLNTSYSSVYRSVTIDSKQQLLARAKLQLIGEAAGRLASIGQYESQRAIQDAILAIAAPGDSRASGSVEASDLSSRLVSDMSFAVTTSQSAQSLRTSAGYRYDLQPAFAELTAIDFSRRESDVEFGEPQRADVTTRIEGATIIGEPPRNCTIKNQWFAMHRKITISGSAIVIATSSAQYVHSVAKNVFASARFQDELNKLRACDEAYVIIWQSTNNQGANHE